MHKYALIAIFYLAGLFSCKENDPPITDTKGPVFTFSGKANGVTVGFSAGLDNYYMSTSFELGSSNIYVFKGDLSRTDCSACGPSLSISFRNYTNQFPFNIDSSVTIGQYEFMNQLTPIETYYRLHCYSSATGIGTPSISWDFGNNRFSTESNPIVEFPVSGIFPISCMAVFPGCFSELNQPVFLTPSRVGKSTNFTINYTDTHTLLFNSIPVANNANITWDFGDSNTAEGTIVKHTYTLSGIYKVCMQFIDGTDTMQLCKNVNTLDVTKCKVNYNFTSELITDSLHLSHVLVEWKNDLGEWYSSGAVEQPANSKFTVINVSDYQPNEKGGKTRKISILFSCLVSNGNQTIELKDVTTTIAVAYP